MVREKFAPRKIVIVIVGFYRYLISPMLGSHCRFVPTCSEYAQTAVGRYGVFKGGWMTLKRLLRCQPFCKGGFDPVPDKRKK